MGRERELLSSSRVPAFSHQRLSWVARAQGIDEGWLGEASIAIKQQSQISLFLCSFQSGKRSRP